MPISDFFWGGFIAALAPGTRPAARRESVLSLRPGLDRHRAEHGPVDPPVRDAEGDAEEVVVKTGFGAVVHKLFSLPMPEMRGWEIDTFEKLERREFDDPRDRRRFHEPATTRSPAWATVSSATRRRGSRRSSPCGPTSRLRQHDRGQRVPDAARRPAERACSGWPSTRSAWARSSTASASIYLECAKAEIDAAARPARRLRDLGRRGLQEGHVLLAGLLARALQAVGGADDRLRPRARAAGDLPRLRQREGDLPRLHRDRHRRLQPARGQGRHGRRRAAPAVRPPHRRSAATATCRSGRPATARPSGARCCASSTRPRAAATSSSPTTR